MKKNEKEGFITGFSLFFRYRKKNITPNYRSVAKQKPEYV
jgi:hypothetical protein